MYRKKDSVTNHQVSQWRLWMDRWAEGKRGKCTNWVVRSINRRLSRLLALLRVPNYIFGDTGFPLFETQDSGLRICSEGGMPKTTAGIGLRAWKTLLEDVNGVNRLATKGKKYYRLPTKREKNYRLPTGKILTHWLPKWTDIIYIFFLERRVYCINIHYKTRVLKSVCREYENFYKTTCLVLHITCEKCLD